MRLCVISSEFDDENILEFELIKGFMNIISVSLLLLLVLKLLINAHCYNSTLHNALLEYRNISLSKLLFLE